MGRDKAEDVSAYCSYRWTMGRQTTPDVLPGTLDLLILRTLQRGTMHGYAIASI